jgi:hypothetical protein
LAGFRGSWNYQGENLPWNERVEREVQPHDNREAPEAQPKDYFSPARFYCVETICAPCGVVIAWKKFAKSESETKILGVSGPLLRMANMSPFLFCICLNMLMMPCLCNCSVILKNIKL